MQENIPYHPSAPSDFSHTKDFKEYGARAFAAYQYQTRPCSVLTKFD